MSSSAPPDQRAKTARATPRTTREAQYRDALMATLLPALEGELGARLPAYGDVDLRAFWPAFEAAAPAHVRAGLRAASLSVGLLPRLMGYGRALPELDAEEREAFIVRAASLPGVAVLLEVAKVVAGLAYFSHPEVQAAGRALGATDAEGAARTKDHP